MESSNQYMHPSLVLVNDEILSTQVRLMELYVKQAEAMAANEAARAQERFQTELTALQEELKQKEIALETQQALSHQADQNLRAEVQELRARLLATQCSLQVRQTELDFARSDAHVLQQRIAQSESTVQRAYASIEIEVARARETWQEELRTLEGQLERKELALQLLQGSVKELEGKLRAEIQDLRSQLAAKTELLKNRTDELQKAQREAALLRRHVQQFTLTDSQTEAAASEAIRIRETLQAELASLRTAFEQKDVSLQQHQTATRELEERLTAQLYDLQSQLAEKQGLLETRSQEIGELTAKTNDLLEQITCLELTNKQTVKEAKAAARALEDSLRARVQELEATVSENAQGLQNRTVELESARSETALLRERIEQLELTGARTEEAKNEVDRRCEALQNEFSNVHRALEQKNSFFAQQETEFRESTERLNAQLLHLQSQLTEQQQLLDTKDRDLGHAAGQIAGLQDRIAQVEFLRAEAQAAAAAEVERGRQESKSELAALQKSLREKEQALQQRQAAIAEFEANLNDQLQDLRNQLTQKQELLDRRDREFRTIGSEAAVLRERIAQLESAASEAGRFAAVEAERIRDELQVELAALQAHLKEKEFELAESQASVRESDARLKARVHDLEIQTTEKQLLLDTRNIEIAGLQNKLTAVLEQLAQFEAGQQEAAAAASNAAVARQRFEAELAARQEELRNLERLVANHEAQSHDLQQTFTAQLYDLQSQLAEKQGLLETRSQEIGELTAKTNDLLEQITCLELTNKQTVKEAKAAARALEDSLRARVQELEATVSENAQGLQNRTVELESARSETALLRERIEQLELTGARTEEAKNEVDRRCEALQNEFSNVHRALEQKNSFFAQQETQFRESSERLHAQLRDLESQVAKERAALESQKRELQSARSEITSLRDRMHELESTKTAVETSVSVAIERCREEYQLELVGLRTELDQRQLALEERQTTIRALEEKLNRETHRLEAQLAEKQTLLNRGHLELQDKSSEISALREEIAQSEFACRQTEMLAATQAEQFRERVRVEIGALDDQLKEKENALKVLADCARESESVSNARIADLQGQLAEKHSLIESQDIELTDFRSRINSLLAQVNDLERTNTEALEQQGIAADHLEQDLRLQVSELQTQLAEKLGLLAIRNDEIQALESKITGLVERIGQAEITLKHAEVAAASEMEQIRRRAEGELAARQVESDQKAAVLQQREAELYSVQQKFQLEINGLRAEVAEKHSLLENRNDELLRVKSELDAVQERMAHLEVAAGQAELESPHTAEGEKEQTRIELDKFWNELSQKERILEQRQAAVNDLEENFQAQINDPCIELTERQVMLESPNQGLLLGEPTLTETQKEKLNRLEQLVETIKADNEKTLISPHNRRWRFSLGRKRRWKS
jgi:chromosome segregation ATPase